MGKRKFDKELLYSCLVRDGATLIGEYDGGGRRTSITYKCKCGIERVNTFSNIVIAGAKCKKCCHQNVVDAIRKNFTSEESKIKRLNNVRNPNKNGYYNLITLTNIINNSNATLLGEYKSLTNYSIISFNCKCGIKDCKRKFNKIAGNTKLDRENPIGAFCDTCIKNRLLIKRDQTNINLYGKLGGINQTTESKEKGIKTCMKKYGVPNSNMAESVKQKKKDVCLTKYGVENPAQNQEVMEKAQKNAKKYKEYKMPSGVIRKVQGYEPFALDELIKLYTEEQIKTDRKDVPRIPYKMEEKQKYYFPDIFIPHENYIIEVKSTWTYNCKTDSIKQKAEACKSLGYKYEIWVYDGSAKRTKEVV